MRSIRKKYLRKIIPVILVNLTLCTVSAQKTPEHKRPNILFCIADDASIQHMTAYGFDVKKWVNTPGFDNVAKHGIIFNKAYTPNAKCSPSRASILTGRNPWQLEEAGNHNPLFPAKFITFMETLAQNGYRTGHTGKGWGPGNPGKINGKPRLLTGPGYNSEKEQPIAKGISKNNYSDNFEKFLVSTSQEKPFCFWYGSREPHRGYEFGSGVEKAKKNPDDIQEVPPFWPDNETVRNDMLDYAVEVEHFDSHITRMLNLLKERGELENTIVIVTSDNGMPFPRIKGNVYDYDNHLPLAIMWKNGIKSPGRMVNDFVSFIDFAPTLLEVANVNPSKFMQPIQGKSLVQYFKNTNKTSGDENRNFVLLGRERTDIGRPDDKGYPVRAIISDNYFYSRNYKPNRWPSGNPETGYLDTDGGPTKTAILDLNRKNINHEFWDLSFGKRPAEEMYKISKDPYLINNIARDPDLAELKESLRLKMEKELNAQGDPRMFGNGDVFDNYDYGNPRVRNFYNRYMNGENIPTPWVRKSDYEETELTKKKLKD